MKAILSKFNITIISSALILSTQFASINVFNNFIGLSNDESNNMVRIVSNFLSKFDSLKSFEDSDAMPSANGIINDLKEFLVNFEKTTIPEYITNYRRFDQDTLNVFIVPLRDTISILQNMSKKLPETDRLRLDLNRILGSIHAIFSKVNNQKDLLTISAADLNNFAMAVICFGYKDIENDINITNSLQNLISITKEVSNKIIELDKQYNSDFQNQNLRKIVEDLQEEYLPRSFMAATILSSLLREKEYKYSKEDMEKYKEMYKEDWEKLMNLIEQTEHLAKITLIRNESVQD